MKGAKEILDCNEQKIMGSGSPQLCAKGSKRRITKGGDRKGLKIEVQLSL